MDGRKKEEEEGDCERKGFELHTFKVIVACVLNKFRSSFALIATQDDCHCESYLSERTEQANAR